MVGLLVRDWFCQVRLYCWVLMLCFDVLLVSVRYFMACCVWFGCLRCGTGGLVVLVVLCCDDAFVVCWLVGGGLLLVMVFRLCWWLAFADDARAGLVLKLLISCLIVLIHDIL